MKMTTEFTRQNSINIIVLITTLNEDDYRIHATKFHKYNRIDHDFK